MVLEVQLVRRCPLLQPRSLLRLIAPSLAHLSQQCGEQVLQPLLVDERLGVLRVLHAQQVVHRLRLTSHAHTHLQRRGSRVLVLANGDQKQVQQLLLAQCGQHR